MRSIDADALIEVIKKSMAENPHKEEMQKAMHIHEHKYFLTLLTSFPTIQPEPQWIPCSERMPEEHEWIGTKQFGTTISDEVYVAFENPKGERFCKHLSFQNGKLSAFDKSTIDAFYKGSKPIAWMPLPEPYKPNK